MHVFAMTAMSKQDCERRLSSSWNSAHPVPAVTSMNIGPRAKRRDFEQLAALAPPMIGSVERQEVHMVIVTRRLAQVLVELVQLIYVTHHKNHQSRDNASLYCCSDASTMPARIFSPNEQYRSMALKLYEPKQ